MWLSRIMDGIIGSFACTVPLVHLIKRKCYSLVICLFIVSNSLIFKADQNSIKLVFKLPCPEAESIPSTSIQGHLPATSGAHWGVARVGVVICLNNLLLVVIKDSYVRFFVFKVGPGTKMYSPCASQRHSE